MLKIRLGALPLTEVKTPLAGPDPELLDPNVSKSVQKAAMTLLTPLCGKQEPQHPAALLLNWRKPFELMLAEPNT